MSGTFYETKNIKKTGSAMVDSVLTKAAWKGGEISYTFPDTDAPYFNDPPYDGNFQEHFGWRALTQFQRNTAYWALDIDAGNAAQDGFSVEGFTNLNIFYTTHPGATIRLSETIDPDIPTAVGYFPAETKSGGDVWFQKDKYAIQQLGTYEWDTVLHEIGHALGLEHAHEKSGAGFRVMPKKYDSMEFTIMTYRSHVGQDFEANGGYSNEQFDYAQSYMMADIAALQHMYGANYSVNSGKTVYKWNPNSGITLVNGGQALVPGDNVIFATIWDGGGVDTYDLSDYSNGVNIDLRPGGHSTFKKSQLADLGPNKDARGNIFNALLHEGNKKSLIENAIGGSGNDVIRGNGANNKLQGKGGNDKLYGANSKDTLIGSGGSDKLFGQGGSDKLKGDAGNDVLKGGAGNDSLFGGGSKDQMFGDSGNDKLKGGGGADELRGGNGKDTLTGGKGFDKLYGGGQADKFVFGKGDDKDVIKDMRNDQDTIRLNDNLWKGNKGINKVLNQFGRNDGGDFVLNFGQGDELRIKDMTKSQLVDDVQII